MALLYFLAFFILTFLLVAGQTPKYVLKGEGDHLKPNIPGQPSSILWKHNGNKIVEFDGSEEQVYHPYKHRITLNWITAELKITDLRYEDSGDYELEVDINDELYSSESKLEVIDKVTTPTISCALHKGSSNNGSEVKATLLCSAEPRKPESLMKFNWRSQGKLHPGNILPISLGDTQTDEEYVCIVRNPLSSEKATFRAKDCYHEKNSPIALGVGLSLLFLFLGAVGTVLFLKWKHKACFAKRRRGDVENQSSDEGSGQKAERTEERRSLIDKAETPANHKKNPGQSTAGQEGLKNNAGEQEPASPPLSPGIKDQGLHENVDKAGDKGNEPQHSDQSNKEKENGPKETDTPEEKSEDKHSDVESTAEGQDSERTEEVAGPTLQQNQGLNTGYRGKDQDKESTEEEVHPSEPSGSDTENESYLTGEKEPEKPTFEPNLTPEQPEADVNGKKEDHDEKKTTGEQAKPDTSQDSGGVTKGHVIDMTKKYEKLEADNKQTSLQQKRAFTSYRASK